MAVKTLNELQNYTALAGAAQHPCSLAPKKGFKRLGFFIDQCFCRFPPIAE